MPLESLRVLDRFDDATHLKLDKSVNEAVEGLSDLVPLSNYAVLLNTIIARSENALDRQYLDMLAATKLIKTHGELRDMLVSAWERRSYREIRNLGACLGSISQSNLILTNGHWLFRQPFSRYRSQS